MKNDLLSQVLGIGNSIGSFFNQKKQDLQQIFSPKIHSPLPAPKIQAYKPAPPVRIAPPVLNKPKNNFLVDFFNKQAINSVNQTNKGLNTWGNIGANVVKTTIPTAAKSVFNYVNPIKIVKNVNTLGKELGKPIVQNINQSLVAKKMATDNATMDRNMKLALKLKSQGNITGYQTLLKLNSDISKGMQEYVNQNLKTTNIAAEQGKKDIVKAGVDVAKDAAYLYGAKVLAKPVSLAIGGTMGAFLHKAFGGKDPYKAAGEMIGEMPKYEAVANVTDAFLGPIIQKAKGILANPAAKQIIGRTLAGLNGTIQNEIVAKMDKRDTNSYERLMAFGLTALLSSGGSTKEWDTLSKDTKDLLTNGGKKLGLDMRPANKVWVMNEKDPGQNLPNFLYEATRKIKEGDYPMGLSIKAKGGVPTLGEVKNALEASKAHQKGLIDAMKTSNNQDEAVVGIKQYLDDQITKLNENPDVKNAKGLRAAINRTMYNLAGVDPKAGLGETKPFMTAFDNPEINRALQTLEGYKTQVDDVIAGKVKQTGTVALAPQPDATLPSGGAVPVKGEVTTPPLSPAENIPGGGVQPQGEVKPQTTGARKAEDIIAEIQAGTYKPRTKRVEPAILPEKVVPAEIKTPIEAPAVPGEKPFGFVKSVQESDNISAEAKAKVAGTYVQKPNTKLMGEAQALLQDGASINFKGTKNLDQKVAATIQEALNLDKAGQHDAAANLYNNLKEHGLELGRGVQAFSLFNKMSPEAMALSAVGKIKQYNLTATRKIPELTGDQVKTISDQVTKIDGLKGRDKNFAINDLKNTLDDFIPSSLVDKAITVWKAGLLTSLRTHERNLLGNTVMGIAEVAKDLPGAFADKVMSLKTGKRSMTFTTKGMGTGAKKGLQAAKDIIQRGIDPEESIAKYDVGKRVNWNVKNPVERLLKWGTDSVFRTLGAEDKPFWHSSFGRSLYDQAGAEAINAGKQGDLAFIENLVNKPTKEMLAIAFNDANIATFHDKNILTSIANGIKRAAKDPKLKMGAEAGKVVTEVLMPFTGVPSSIVGKTIAYSPIGLVKGSIKVGRVLAGQVPELQRQAAQEVGRGVIGTGLFSIGAYLMSKGLMTGQPKDAAEADLWTAQGKQANSVMLFGKWRSINSIGPQFLIMLAGSKWKQDGGDIGKYGASLAKDTLSQSFLQGIQMPLNAITDPARYGKNYFGNMAASVIPNIVKDAARALDPNARETNTIPDYFKSGVPGWRNTLLPKRDVLGNEVKQEPTGAGAFFDLFNSKTPIDNTTINELVRLSDTGNEATPSRLKADQTIQKQKIKLTFEQLNQLEKGVGEALKPELETLIQSSTYQSLADDAKAKEINDLVSEVRLKYKNLHGEEILSTAMPDTNSYETSPEAPKTIPEKVILAAQGIGVDPANTIKAIFTEERMRKISGNTMVLERKNNLNQTPNEGDVRDHIIPLALGGDNSPENLRYISPEANQSKATLETKLAKQLKEGTITKEEARKQVKEWVDSYEVTDSTDVTAKIEIVNQDTGKTKTIDTSKWVIKPSGTTAKETEISTEISPLIKKYFPKDQWNNAQAVMSGESGGDSQAIGDNYPINGLLAPSYGLFQIRGLSGRPDPSVLLNPEENVKYAAQMYAQQGWGPWTVAQKLGIVGGGQVGISTLASMQGKKTLSAINAQMNDIYDLYNAGKMSKEEANSMLAQLSIMKTANSKTATAKKPKKLPTTKAFTMDKLPEISKFIGSSKSKAKPIALKPLSADFFAGQPKIAVPKPTVLTIEDLIRGSKTGATGVAKAKALIAKSKQGARKTGPKLSKAFFSGNRKTS